MKPARDAIWQAAREAADVIVSLPTPGADGNPVELFVRLIPATGPEGFRMGARGFAEYEEPIHRVVIDERFFLGTFAVTQEQWAAVWPAMDAAAWYPEGSSWGKPPGAKPSGHADAADSPRRPVEDVSWYDALAMCECLSRHARVVKGAEVLGGEAIFETGWRFCLPTEAEWEYACRGGPSQSGSDTEYWNGDGEAALAEVGWYQTNSDYRTHDVAEPVVPDSPEQHPLGLFGMHGNVWEWCHDTWSEGAYRRHADGERDLTAGPRRDLLALYGSPAAVCAALEASRDLARVIRGGSWNRTAWWCRSAFRIGIRPGFRNVFRGFRVCLVRGPVSQAGGGAAAASERAEAEQAEQDKASGTRPQSSAAGKAGAGQREGQQAAERPPAAQPRAGGWIGNLFRRRGGDGAQASE